MIITNIIFILSFALFVAYTVVSLAFLNKRRAVIHNELHELVAQEMTDVFGRLTPDPAIALRLLKQMSDRFQTFNDESSLVNSNIIRLSLMTAGVGICTALCMIVM